MSPRSSVLLIVIIGPLVVAGAAWWGLGHLALTGIAIGVSLLGVGLVWSQIRGPAPPPAPGPVATTGPALSQPDLDQTREANIALSAAVVDLLATAETTIERTASATTAAEGVSRDTHTIATGAEEMSATVREIAATTGEAARVAGEAANLATAAETAVHRLGDSSRAIGAVVETISAIAGQTNLLALNATIEAARAGEAGRGFAVVAGEVKTLARQTADATADVGRRIAAIQADTAAAIESIAAINARIRRIHEVQLTVASAVEEQSATTQELSRTIAGTANTVSAIASEVAGVSGDARLAAMSMVVIRDLAQQATTSVERLRVQATAAAGLPPAIDVGLPPVFFDRVIRAHIGWRSRLLNAIDGRTIPDRTTAADHGACELGKCLHIEQQRLSRHPDFPTLVEQHRLFHAAVGRVIDLVVAKRTAEARSEIIGGEFAQRSQATIALIARIRPVTTHDVCAQLAWSPQYATGVELIDTQHRELFAKVAALHDAMMAGAGRSRITELVGFLADYTVKHFADEEKLMERAGYAELAGHRELHRSLLAQVGDLRTRLDRGDVPQTAEVTDFLAGWLRQHILRSDHAYIPSMRSAGLAAPA